jgi:hypothetical protein
VRLQIAMDLNPENFYKDLINVELNVPCSSWDDEEYCLKNFGPDWRTTFVKGIVKKFKLSRKSKEPLFEIHFPDKKGDKTFTGYPIEYIWKHSEEVPLKYHYFKAAYILKLSSEAAKLDATPPLSAVTPNEDLKKSADDTGNEINFCKNIYVRMLMAAVLHFYILETEEENDKAKKATSISKKRQREAKGKTTDTDIDGSDCSELDEDEDDEIAGEVDDFFDASAPIMDTENVEEFRFEPCLWKANELPVQPPIEFLGATGPLHQLTSTAGPFDFFVCSFQSFGGIDGPNIQT